MKKIGITLAVLTVVSTVYANDQFSNDQLAQFEKTNKCRGCDLSGAFIQYNHSGAILENANLSSLNGPHGYDTINFSNANLKNANLSGAYLDESNFSGANLTGAHFDGAILLRANFYGAIGANLKNARDLCEATLPDGSIGECHFNAKKH